MTPRTLSAVQKVDDAYVEDASKTATDSSEQEVIVREFDPKFMRKTTLKVRWLYYLPRGRDSDAVLASHWHDKQCGL